MEKGEKTLVKRAMRGNPKAFGTLVEREQEYLYRMAFLYVRQEQDALDVVQESILKAYKSLKTLREPEYFRTWLTKIVINTAQDTLRARQRMAPLEEELDLPAPEGLPPRGAHGPARGHCPAAGEVPGRDKAEVLRRVHYPGNQRGHRYAPGHGVRVPAAGRKGAANTVKGGAGMQKEVDNILVEIPEALPARVGEALSQVRAIHRRRVLRRLGGAVGSVVAVLAATVTLAAVNPALASQIPLVGEWLGGLFYEAGHDSKPGTGGAFIGTYSSALEDVEVPAATENGEWGITFRQGYTDGHKVMLSLSLTGPQADLERYSSVLFAGYGQTSTATINGETAQIQGVNSFEEREGSWDTTMAVVVPESQQEAETLEVAVTLQGLEGQMAELGAHGEVKTISTEPIQGSFSASFTLTVDHSNDYAFVSQAEDNRAKVFAVSGTPTQTVVSVEIPFWGYRNFGALEEDGVKGSARLVLPDGTQLRPDDRRSADLGGYDYRAAKTQSCDLYFDGLPAGTSQVELEFFWQEVGTQQEEVLASFTLDLANQEITAAGTQGVELGSTQYSLLETGDTGWEENGFTVKDVWFSQAESYTGHVYFYLPDDCLETNLQVEVQNAQGETLFRSQAYGEDGAPNPDWTLQPAFAIANLPQPLNICQVTQRLTGAVVPVGEMVTVILSDASTGETLFTDTRALVAAAP